MALSVKTQLVGGGEQEWYRFPRLPRAGRRLDAGLRRLPDGRRRRSSAGRRWRATAGSGSTRAASADGLYANVDAAWNISPKTKLGARYLRDIDYSAFATTGADADQPERDAEVYLDKMLASNVYFRLFGRLGQLASDGDDHDRRRPTGVETAVRDDRGPRGGSGARLPVPVAGPDRGARRPTRPASRRSRRSGSTACWPA